MLCLVPILFTLVMAGEPDKPRKTAVEMYDDFKGPWRTDDQNSPLSGFWLHRYEKSADLPPGGTDWGVKMDFRRGSAETYEGAAAKVETDGAGLKVTLPPAAKGEDRKAQTVRLRRVGAEIEVSVDGGPSAGTYKLKRVPSKQ